jgi:hypothetical protein
MAPANRQSYLVVDVRHSLFAMPTSMTLTLAAVLMAYLHEAGNDNDIADMTDNSLTTDGDTS